MTAFARPSAGGAFSYPAGAAEVAIVGAGRVGCSIGRALAKRGHRIVAATTTSPVGAVRVREYLGEVPIASPEDAALAADIVVICVPDDAIEDVIARSCRGLRSGATVVHTSGFRGTEVLEPCGARVSAVHPAVAVAQPDQSFDDVWFDVTCPDEMREWSSWFVAEVGGRTHFVSEEDRVRYHASMTFASNFVVALAGDAERLLPNEEIIAQLLRRAVENVIAFGPAAALTGPVSRGDTSTLRAHLSALPPDLVESYVVNSRRALALSVHAGRIDAAKAAAVADLLSEVRV